MPWWLALNEIRNRLIHEYAMTPTELTEEIGLAWIAAGKLHAELTRIKNNSDIVKGLFSA